MKRIKNYILCLLSLCCVFSIFNITNIKAFSISKGDFKAKDSSEVVVKHTPIGYWNNGGFFETVTWKKVGSDSNTGYETYRFRYYVTHRGDNSSYIYQKIPVGLLIDGTRKATFDQRNNGNVRNTTKLWGEYTMSLAPGRHKIQLADISGGAITVVNVTQYIEVKVPQYTVTFVDYNGIVLKKQSVNLGKDATPPSNPNLTGHSFTGWNGDYKNVRSNRTITAQYDVNKFTVNFIDWNNNILKSETVNYGGSASPPSNPSRTGYTFTGWNGSYTSVISNRTITASYKINTYNITFNSNGGTSVPSQTITYGDKVQQPPNPTKGTDKFMGWYIDASLTNNFDFNSSIMQNLVLTAKWDSIPVIKANDITIFENLYEKAEWEKVRKENATAQDKEDGNITSKIKISYDNVELNKSGEYKVIYEVTDSARNTVKKEIKVSVVDKTPDEEKYTKRIRSISKEYVNTLHTKSKWRLDTILNNALNATLNKSATQAKEVWVLTKGDVEKIKAFNKSHDYSPASNQLFLQMFGALKE